LDDGGVVVFIENLFSFGSYIMSVLFNVLYIGHECSSDDLDQKRLNVYSLFIAIIKFSVYHKNHARYFSLSPILGYKEGMVMNHFNSEYVTSTHLRVILGELMYEKFSVEKLVLSVLVLVDVWNTGKDCEPSRVKKYYDLINNYKGSWRLFTNFDFN
jgi:hypothetical protein